MLTSLILGINMLIVSQGGMNMPIVISSLLLNGVENTIGGTTVAPDSLLKVDGSSHVLLVDGVGKLLINE